MDFHARLLHKSVLPELQNIKEFALANGLMELKGSSRQKVVNPLVNALAELPIQRVRRALHLGKSYTTVVREDSLEDWTELILERGRKNREKILKAQNMR